jgi:hypothetical protein
VLIRPMVGAVVQLSYLREQFVTKRRSASSPA